MKKSTSFFAFIILLFCSFSVFSQNGKEPLALGLPGDNLNLYAVLDVFQKSPTLEEFEKAINDKEKKINNLDLNNDNLIDYIQVASYKENDSYSIVLRTAINDKEFQDVAVIEVNKNKDGKVLVQVIGDEDLYGKNYIIEPTSSKTTSTPNPGYVGDKTIIINNYSSGINGIYYVNDWPLVAYLFSPGFSFYISPWHWGFYPTYWYPWAPVYYYNYWGYQSHDYHNHFYRRAPQIRYPEHYSYYSNRRNSSSIVSENRRRGTYSATYEGKNYRKPEAPSVRTINPPRTLNAPRVRKTVPSTQSVIPKTPRNNPTPRAVKPSPRVTNPTPRSFSPPRESNQQATPNTRRR